MAQKSNKQNGSAGQLKKVSEVQLKKQEVYLPYVWNVLLIALSVLLYTFGKVSVEIFVILLGLKK